MFEIAEVMGRLLFVVIVLGGVLALIVVLVNLRGEVRALAARLRRLEQSGDSAPTPAGGPPSAAAPESPPESSPPATSTVAPPPGPTPADRSTTASDPLGSSPLIRAGREDVRRPPVVRSPAAERRTVSGDNIPDTGMRARVEPLSFEAFVGRNVFLFVGVVVVLAGLGWFLVHAVERGWIGPAARVGLGVLAGLAALAGGEALQRRGYHGYGHALMGGGLGALYLCVYFAAVRYALVGRMPGFAMMAALTATGVVLAVRRDAAYLAVLGFVGGFLAPGLLSTGADRLVGLAAWDVLLVGGVLAVLLHRDWRGLDMLAAIGTTTSFAGWYGAHGAAHGGAPGLAAGVLAAETLALLAMVLTPALVRRSAPSGTGLVSAVLALLSAFLGGHALLYPEHRVAFGIGLLVLVGVLEATGRGLSSRSGSAAAGGGARALALATLVVVVPILGSGHAVPAAWALLGLALAEAALRTSGAHLRIAGFVMIALGECSLVFHLPLHDGTFLPVLNADFVAFALPSVALMVAGTRLSRAATEDSSWGDGMAVLGALLLTPVLATEAADTVTLVLDVAPARLAETVRAAVTLVLAVWGVFVGRAGRDSAGPNVRLASLLPILAAGVAGLMMIGPGHPGTVRPFLQPVGLVGVVLAVALVVTGRGRERPVAGFLAAAGIAFLLLHLRQEIFQWGERGLVAGLDRAEVRFRAEVAVSIAWALYAALLVVGGFLRSRPLLRWAGITIFGLTLAKVVLFDTAHLDVVHRVLSFLGLGSLLVAVSFLYQRRQTADDPGSSGIDPVD